jgi:serine protease Do
MSIRWLLGVSVIVATTSSGARAAGPKACSGYAEDLSALSPRARDIEAHAAKYTVAVRTIATYECPWFAPDGSLRRTRQNVQAHGTAFGYRIDGGDTLLVTNDHVASWPAATDAEHAVDGVAAGCRRVSTELKIVDDDHDTYAADDIPLSLAVTDPTLDFAILRAHQRLPVMPWKIGTSSAITTRDVVEIKGFPLGELAATNVGKVTSPFDHDEQGEWNHDDFVVDALVSSGNSGSPVFAVSCKTGEFELVGVFHAHYNNASALNVVIAIDQARDMMATLKAPPHPKADALAFALDVPARAQLQQALGNDVDPPFFAFGSLTASVHARADGALVFAVFGAEFPHSTRPLLVVEDVVTSGQFGTLGDVYVGGATGLVPLTQPSADDRALLARTLDALRRDALVTFALRDTPTPSSRDAFQIVEAKRKALTRMLDGQRDTQQALVELSGRAPAPNDKSVSLSRLETEPARAATKH